MVELLYRHFYSCPGQVMVGVSHDAQSEGNVQMEVNNQCGAMVT